MDLWRSDAPGSSAPLTEIPAAEARRHTIAIYIKDEEIHDPEDVARQHGFEYGGRIGS